MPHIHPTAIIDPSAILHDQVHVGPLCAVGPNVELGPGTILRSHVSIEGPCRIGARNVIHPFAALGGDPQHRDYDGEETWLELGDDNVVREHVTIHRGTVTGGGVTRVGSHNLLMAGSHVAHDARLGDHVTLTNGVLLGGHVCIEDWVVAAGHVAVAPFVRVGTSAFLAGNAMVERDVPPFVIAAGDRATLRAINRVGLRRRQVPEVSMAAIHRAFLLMFPQCGERAAPDDPRVIALAEDRWVAALIAFVRVPGKLGLAPRHHRRGAGDAMGSSGPSGSRVT